MPKRVLLLIVALILTLSFSSCSSIYFNTFHNIRKNFNAAEKSRKKAGRDNARGAETKRYTDAITKAARVLERHPTSSWVDDALYIIGASYYYLGEYSKSARKFKELLANYPESEFVPTSRLLLAKAKLKLKEETEAVVIFEDIFNKDSDRKMKAEAARALGEYYFDAKDYQKANTYFLALIDSIGDSDDKLRAYMYVADGYYEKYDFKDALANYEKALKESPDTLQMYSINFRMAECDYFLFNFDEGLELLQEMADNSIYYDSLAAIRMKMAEGYEWNSDLESAISTYEQITIENPRKEVAARAYYELALIYQYDYEDLPKARTYFAKARDESRRSSVREDATRRASRLALLEQYTESEKAEAQSDSVKKIDTEQLNQLSKNQFLLGELYYFDLDKPDSAISAFKTLLARFPKTDYAPKALLSMSYIEKTEMADTNTADSLLREVLQHYAHYDEAKTAIGLLGLSGTVADTGYAAIYFEKGEDFLLRFQNLDRKWYFPFEVRFVAPVDTLPDSLSATEKTDSTATNNIEADSTQGEQPPDSLAAADSSVFVPTSSPNYDEQNMSGMSLAEIVKKNRQAQHKAQSDSNRFDPEAKPTESDSLKLKAEKSATSKKLEAIAREEKNKEIQKEELSQEDTTSGRVRLKDLLRQRKGETIPPDSASADTMAQGMVIDSLPAGIPLDSIGVDSNRVHDSTVPSTDSIRTTDTTALLAETAIDSLDTTENSVDTDMPIDTVARTPEYYAALSLLDSARYYYQYVVDSFPFSDYSVQARYLLLWTYDKYFAPGDSSMIDLYGAFVDSFPESPYTDEIIKEYNIRPSAKVAHRQQRNAAQNRPSESESTDSTTIIAEGNQTENNDAFDVTKSPEYKFITDEDGNQLKNAAEYYQGTTRKFEYPLEALADRIEDDLYFHIRIDFNGEVDEIVLLNPTQSVELNERATETVKNARFDSGRIPTELYDTWFYYKFEVRIPPKLRQ